MTALQLLQRMGETPVPIPRMPDLQVIFSMLLGDISDRLTPKEIDGFIELGAVIGQRTTRLAHSSAA